jgi:hypothetical protein
MKRLALILAALLAGSTGSTAPAPLEAAQVYCNYPFERCYIYWEYFSDASHSTQVGLASSDCFDEVIVWWGYRTSHYNQYVGSCAPD